MWPTCFCYWAFHKVISLFPAGAAAIGVTAGAVALGEPVGWRGLVALALIASALALELSRPTGAP